MKTTNIYAYV